LVLAALDQPSILLRTAKPTFDDGLAYARYLDEAAEGFFRVMLGRRVADIIATAYVQPGHDFSYQNVTFAEYGNVIVGMISGYTAEQHRRSSRQPLKLAAGYRTFRMMRVAVCCAPFRSILDSIADGDFYLQAIAIDRESRGTGIGSVLLEAIEDQAVASGSGRLTLDVSSGNEGARKLYERRGMTVEYEWPKLKLVPPLLVRMVKTL
jgi:ribosomal protein S18 acetylase RimI-like enzyme